MQHIYWILPESVGGRCGPAAAPWDLPSWAEAGIGGIVSLDDSGVLPEEIQAAGLAHLPAYCPMILLTTPELQRDFLQRLPAVFRFLDEQAKRGRKAVVHCFHGMDRTGAVLACYLIHRFRCSAQEAIAAVRRVRPQAMSADGYEEAVFRFADELAAGSCIFGRYLGK